MTIQDSTIRDRVRQVVQSEYFIEWTAPELAVEQPAGSRVRVRRAKPVGNLLPRPRGV